MIGERCGYEKIPVRAPVKAQVDAVWESPGMTLTVEDDGPKAQAKALCGRISTSMPW